MNGDSDLSNTVKEKIERANYYLVFFCELVDGYTQDGGVRRETEEEARLKHEILRDTYKEFDLKFVSLPAISVKKRIQIISNNLLEGSI
jgi:predicted ATPase